MIILYCDEHVMSITPGTCIECERELSPVKYYRLDEVLEKMNLFVYRELSKIEKTDIDQEVR